MEYAVHGNLRHFLRANRSEEVIDNVTSNVYCDMTKGRFKVKLNPEMLGDFALQVARGMEYLASRKVGVGFNIR